MDNSKKGIFFGILLVLLIGCVIAYDTNIANLRGIENLKLEENGGVPVNIQDQTTRLFDIQVNQILSRNYELASIPVINSYDLELNTTVGISVGDKIAFIEQNGMPQIFFGFVMAISGNNITLNSPVPFNYIPARTEVFIFDNQVNVDGSVTPQVFSLVNFFDEDVDITRIIWKCTDNVEMHDGLFCGIDQLLRGVEFRKLTKDGYYINYFNVRNNAKWALLAYDTSYSDTGKPPANTYGFGSRLTFGGQSKHGVVIRLEPGESIELVIQDDLTDIGGASLMVEGHFKQV